MILQSKDVLGLEDVAGDQHGVLLEETPNPVPGCVLREESDQDVEGGDGQGEQALAPLDSHIRMARQQQVDIRRVIEAPLQGRRRNVASPGEGFGRAKPLRQSGILLQ